MKTITFYSYKGGTGRSLALANAARYLARLEFRVAVLDFDLEAPGLHYKFSTGSGDQRLPIERGVVDYLHRFVVEGQSPGSIKEFAVDVTVPGVDKPLIHLIPAGKVPSMEYWSKLSRINWHELFYSDKAQGVQIFLDLKNRIEEEIKPDFLLIDSRTGITEMGGVATTLLADMVVCLVLPALENLEGARAILRSLRRSRHDFGLPPVDVMVALSRLPELEKAEDEREVTDHIRTILNEEAENLEDTLSCSNIFILHSESSLEVREVLRVGSGVSPDESVLLRDYLRLFASIVPKEVVEPNIGKLIEQAKDKIWQDPDGALKEVEELAESFGHPEIYKALLRFYEVRNVTSPAVVRRAQSLWDITQDSEELLLWNAMKRTWATEPVWRTFTQKGWRPNLDFVESVWRSVGKQDSNFGTNLAKAYQFIGKPSRSADVLLEIIKTSEPSPALVAMCISRLEEVGRTAESETLIHGFKDAFADETEFLETWATHALKNKDKQSFAELVEPTVLNLLRRSRPILAYQLLTAVGRDDEAHDMTDEVLRGVIEQRASGRDIEETAKLFHELERWDEFESKTQGRIPKSILEQLRERLGRRRSYL